MKMYNVLVVEDEKFTRDMVVSYLKNEISEYFNIYSADDGKSALEFMETVKIDIVVTDIMMQFMDGIELAEKIHKNYENCIVFIMSGYDEFKYAQKAIRFNVRRYFLKPFDLAELCDECMSYREELERKRRNSFDYFGELLVLRESFFSDFVYNESEGMEEKLKKAKKLSFPFDLENTPCDIILLKIDEYESFLADKWYYGAESFSAALSNLIAAFLKNRYIFCIREENGYFEYIIFHEKENIDYNALMKKISAIANVSALLCKNPEIFSNIKEIKNHKKETENMEDSAFSFISHIKSKNYSEAAEILKKAYENKFVWKSFKNILSKFGLSLEDGEELSDNSVFERYNAILKSNGDAENINDNISVSIERAKKYIRENYGKNILREDAAKAAYFSSSYFTKNFKSYTGESFSDYLLNVRMENAARLIKEDKYKVSQIADMVGYQNPKYFHRVFKMYYGCTPKEYALNPENKRKIEREQEEG